jgi:carbon storage regulator
VLVLTRKVGDVIAIGDNIKIVVMAIRGKQVRLGIEADRSTVVHRGEIYEKIKNEMQEASGASPEDSKAAIEIFKRNKGSSLPGAETGLKPRPHFSIKKNPKTEEE